MKKIRMRIFGYDDKPCEKLYFNNLELVQRVDGNTDLEGLTQFGDVVELYLAYKITGGNVREILID